jgi:streptogramin lyase
VPAAAFAYAAHQIDGANLTESTNLGRQQLEFPARSLKMHTFSSCDSGNGTLISSSEYIYRLVGDAVHLFAGNQFQGPTQHRLSKKLGALLFVGCTAQATFVVDASSYSVYRVNKSDEFELIMSGDPAQSRAMETPASGKVKAGSVFFPTRISIAPDGAVVLTDAGNLRILRIFSQQGPVATAPLESLEFSTIASWKIEDSPFSVFVNFLPKDRQLWFIAPIAGGLGHQTDEAGNIWVANTLTNEIQMITPSGVIETILKGASQVDLAVATVRFIEMNKNRLGYIFNDIVRPEARELISSFARQPTKAVDEHGCMPGKLVMPFDLAMSGENILVADAWQQLHLINRKTKQLVDTLTSLEMPGRNPKASPCGVNIDMVNTIIRSGTSRQNPNIHNLIDQALNFSDASDTYSDLAMSVSGTKTGFLASFSIRGIVAKVSVADGQIQTPVYLTGMETPNSGFIRGVGQGAKYDITFSNASSVAYAPGKGSILVANSLQRSINEVSGEQVSTLIGRDLSSFGHAIVNVDHDQDLDTALDTDGRKKWDLAIWTDRCKGLDATKLSGIPESLTFDENGNMYLAVRINYRVVCAFAKSSDGSTKYLFTHISRIHPGFMQYQQRFYASVLDIGPDNTLYFLEPMSGVFKLALDSANAELERLDLGVLGPFCGLENPIVSSDAQWQENDKVPEQYLRREVMCRGKDFFSEQLEVPLGMTVDSEGGVIIANTGANCLQRFDGKELRDYNSNCLCHHEYYRKHMPGGAQCEQQIVHGPISLKFDSRGRLFVTQAGNKVAGKIISIDPKSGRAWNFVNNPSSDACTLGSIDGETTATNRLQMGLSMVCLSRPYALDIRDNCQADPERGSFKIAFSQMFFNNQANGNILEFEVPCFIEQIGK